MSIIDNTEKILNHWGLGDAAVTPIESPSQSTWDIDGKYILKKTSRFSNADELKRGIQFSNLLIEQGISVAAFVPTTNGQLTTPDDEYCLMTKLPGKHADFYKEPHLAFEMGRELARLHTSLAAIESEIKCSDNDLLADWKNWIRPGLDGFVSHSIIDDVDTRFHNLYPKLPRQLIHRDVHLHNVLFVGDKLTGWLDFDISQKNVRLFDVAYLLAGLIHRETADAIRVKMWRSFSNELLLGYDEVNLLTPEEREALPVLMIVIEFLFLCSWNGRGNAEQRDSALELAIWLYNDYRRRTLV